MFSNPLLSAVSCANSSGGHLPLSGTNFSSQDVELTLLTLCLLPIPPQQSSLPGSSGRTKGLLEEELHIAQAAEGLILRALGQTFYSPGPQTYFLPYSIHLTFIAHIFLNQ